VPAPATADVPVPRPPPRRSAQTATPAADTEPPAAASTPAAEARIPTQAELPEAVRRELPALTFGGAMHSPNAASRMLIVNGQLFHEGDKIGPELWLEQIKLKDAVLRYKQHRYSVSY
jgi:general secretion pathway protein B